jgi:transposase
LAHVQHTPRQDHLPELGTKIADQGNRHGVAERFADPAVQKTIAVDLALIEDSDRRLSDLELSIVKTAKQPDAHTFYRLRSTPGVGKIWALVMRYESHDIRRFPRVQDVVSYCRVVQWAKESAGKRWGTSGKKIGTAHLRWALAEAAPVFLRHNPAGQTYLARLEKTQGQGQALTLLAHQLARAVYARLTRQTACAMAKVLTG